MGKREYFFYPLTVCGVRGTSKSKGFPLLEGIFFFWYGKKGWGRSKRYGKKGKKGKGDTPSSYE